MHFFILPAFFLNPAIQYGPENEKVTSSRELQTSLKKVIGVLVPNLLEQAQCIEEVKIFRESRGEFSNHVTVAARFKMMPGELNIFLLLCILLSSTQP